MGDVFQVKLGKIIGKQKRWLSENIRYYGRLPEDYIGHDHRASSEVKTNKKIQINFKGRWTDTSLQTTTSTVKNTVVDSPGGKLHSGWERAVESGMTRNTPPSAGKLKNHNFFVTLN